MEQFNDTLHELIFLLALGMGIYMGIKLHYAFFLVPVAVFAAGIIYKSHKKANKQRDRRREIESAWGKAKTIKKKNSGKHNDNKDYINADAYYRTLISSEHEFQIDSITWRDLNMDAVLQKIDYTMSFAGLQHLYNLLRRPLLNKEDVEKRNRQIEIFQNNKDMAILLQQNIDALGSSNIAGINEFLSGKSKFKSRSTLLYRMLASSVVIVPLLIIYMPLVGIYTAILVLLSNIAIYNKLKSDIAVELSTFKYFGRLIKCMEKLAVIDIPPELIDKEKCTQVLSELKKLNKLIKKLSFSSAFDGNSSIKSDFELVMEYFNMVMLREPIIFYQASVLLNRQYNMLNHLHNEAGRLDAYLSIASYRDSLTYYTKPFIDESSSETKICCSNIYHPLLSAPIPNSIELSHKGALITGSNASGKSTFLRTIGINTVFAQTICTVLASEYKASLFKVMTSIGNVDNIIEGDSYFMSEAKSLKRIIDELEHDNHVLCILDEIFRGTNTIERISSATAVLEYLERQGCCVIAATHDIELTKLVSGNFSNYHFQEEVNENDIYFDYKLHMGACTSRNAILILKQLGYPETVYQDAMNMAVNFEKK